MEKVETGPKETRHAGAINEGRNGGPSGARVAGDVRVVWIVEVVGSKRCRRVSIGCVEEVVVLCHRQTHAGGPFHHLRSDVCVVTRVSSTILCVTQITSVTPLPHLMCHIPINIRNSC